MTLRLLASFEPYDLGLQVAHPLPQALLHVGRRLAAQVVGTSGAFVAPCASLGGRHRIEDRFRQVEDVSLVAGRHA